MNIILFDDASRNNLLPLTFTRPVSEMRMGILTMRERWEKFLGVPNSCLSQEYLRLKYPLIIEETNLLINSSVFPNQKLIEQVLALKVGQALVSEHFIISAKMECKRDEVPSLGDMIGFERVQCATPILKINEIWELFTKNGEALKLDFDLVTKGRKTQPISTTNTFIGDKNLVFLEEGAKVECAILNTTDGPIYLGKNAEIMEGSVIRGPLALCHNATIKMASKVYGNTTIGPFSKIGGEVNNIVMFGYSNKAHDGFLGNSVIGEWCNFGADSNNSNLKNNYSTVKMWNYHRREYVNTGLQFCGMAMGDHSKCSINTMFNTGTVVGIYSNIFGTGFPNKIVPSFTWGGVQMSSIYLLEKAFEVTQRVYERRSFKFTDEDKALLTHMYNLAMTYRNI